MSTQPDFTLLAAALKQPEPVWQGVDLTPKRDALAAFAADMSEMMQRFGVALREAEAAGLLDAEDLRSDACAELDSPDAFIDRVDTLLATVDAARCDVDQEFDATGLPKESA